MRAMTLSAELYVEATTESTEAYLVDVSEIGAALGSGDLRLLDEIVRENRVRASRESTSADDRAIRACLRELLDGGALDGEDAQCYVDAFCLLCRYFGQRLTAGPISDLDPSAMTDSPFDVPADNVGTVIKMVDRSGTFALLGAESAGRSILTFTHEAATH